MNVVYIILLLLLISIIIFVYFNINKELNRIDSVITSLQNKINYFELSKFNTFDEKINYNNLLKSSCNDNIITESEDKNVNSAIIYDNIDDDIHTPCSSYYNNEIFSNEEELCSKHNIIDQNFNTNNNSIQDSKIQYLDVNINNANHYLSKSNESIEYNNSYINKINGETIEDISLLGDKTIQDIKDINYNVNNKINGETIEDISLFEDKTIQGIKDINYNVNTSVVEASPINTNNNEIINTDCFTTKESIQNIDPNKDGDEIIKDDNYSIIIEPVENTNQITNVRYKSYTKSQLKKMKLEQLISLYKSINSLDEDAILTFKSKDEIINNII